MAERRCEAVAKHGRQCSAFPLASGRCWNHSPELAADIRAARSKGGKVRALVARRRKLEDAGKLAVFLADLIEDVLAGRVDAGCARTAFYGASVLRQVVETSELERRLAALEAAMGATTVRRVR